MRPRARIARTYEDVGVPGYVTLFALATWLLVGVPIGLHFASFNMSVTEAVFVGWSAGGFASAFLYILLACE